MRRATRRTGTRGDRGHSSSPAGRAARHLFTAAGRVDVQVRDQSTASKGKRREPNCNDNRRAHRKPLRMVLRWSREASFIPSIRDVPLWSILVTMVSSVACSAWPSPELAPSVFTSAPGRHSTMSESLNNTADIRNNHKQKSVSTSPDRCNLYPRLEQGESSSSATDNIYETIRMIKRKG